MREEKNLKRTIFWRAASLLSSMPSPTSTHSADKNPGSDASTAEQPVDDLKFKEGSKPASPEPDQSPVRAPSEVRSTRPEDVYDLPFEPYIPNRGPMRDFVITASEQLGLPRSHAWALWIYVTMTHCGHHLFYDDGCLERRMGINVVLAGDDESRIARRLAATALEHFGTIAVVTDPSILQLKDSLIGFSGDIRCAVIETGDDNLFSRWNKRVSKEEISLTQLFSTDALNDYLRSSIRAKSMPAVSVPVMLSCELKDVLRGRNFPFSVFRDGLVVPSFGCQQPRVNSAEQTNGLLAILKKSCLEFPEEEIFLRLGQHAKKELEERFDFPKKSPVSLKQEGNHSAYRFAGMTWQIMVLAAVYAINSSLEEKGRSFEGEINKADMASAIEAFDRLDRHWNCIDRFYEELSRADESDTVYDLVIARFQSFRVESFGGLVLQFRQLAEVFCHHPQREGQFHTGHLEGKILADLVSSGRAKELPGKGRRGRKWVFYDSGPEAKALPVSQ